MAVELCVKHLEQTLAKKVWEEVNLKKIISMKTLAHILERVGYKGWLVQNTK